MIEGYTDKIEAKINKDIAKARKRFGDAFNETEFRTTNQRIIDRQTKIDEVLGRMNRFLSEGDLESLKSLIEELEIACPVSGSRNWTDVRQFNLMFSTQLGNISGAGRQTLSSDRKLHKVYLSTSEMSKKVQGKRFHLVLLQIGKAFRNEIIARQFIFRMREFEQIGNAVLCSSQEKKWNGTNIGRKSEWNGTSE